MNRIVSLISIISVFLPVVAFADFQVIPVPYRQFNTTIPHPAYNGRPTIFKAIGRGECAGGIQFQWDFEGGGNYTETGWITTGDPSTLEGIHTFTGVSQRTVIIAEIAVKCGNNNYYFAQYPVVVYPDPPAKENANSASNEALSIMKEVAIDDALWYLHKHLARVSNGTSSISGYVPESTEPGTIAASSLFLMALTQNGHLPAYPPGTYNDFGKSEPSGFDTTNDFKWNSDPYAEDAIRLLNYLLTKIQISTIPAADESDDGTAPIPETNDGRGFVVGSYPDTENNARSLPLAAIARSGLAGTVAQVGDSTYVLGHTMEYIVQQLVDYAAAAQNHENSPANAIGGWYFTVPSCLGCPSSASYADSYASGGWYAALISAEEAMGTAGVHVNRKVKDRIANMLYYNQNPDGGPKLRNDSAGSVFAPAGLSLLACKWLGWDLWQSADTTSAGYPYVTLTKGQARQIYDNYYNYISSHWGSSSGPCSGVDTPCGLWQDNYYNSNLNTHSYTLSIYNTKLGATYGYPNQYFGSHDWFREFNVDYVKHQQGDGSILAPPSSNYWLNIYFDSKGHTAYAILTMVSGLEEPDPVAVGEASPLTVMEGCAGSEYGKVTFSHGDSFHLSSTSNIVDYQWLFDAADPVNPNFSAVNWSTIPNGQYSADGRAWHSNNRDLTPFYTYSRAGTHYAALRVVDNSNPAKTDIDVLPVAVLPVANVAPSMVSAGGPYFVDTGSSVVLTGQAYDPNIPCGDTLTYIWDVSNHGYTLGGPTPSLTAAQVNGLGLGTFPVSLTVIDSFMGTSSASTTLSIYDNTPVARFTAAPNPAACGQSVAFNGSGSSHGRPDRSIVSYTWDFGDGGTAEGVTVSHTYNAFGTYTARLTVTDNNVPPKTGSSASTISINLGNRPPIANPGGPYMADLGKALYLSGVSSQDPDAGCGDVIVSYSWNIANGKYELAGPSPVLTPTQVSSLAIGTEHPVSLTVIDSFGRAATAWTTLTIYDSRPFAVILTDSTTVSCQSVNFDASDSYHGRPDLSIVRYEWDFDYNGVAFVADASGVTVSHTYTSIGTHTTALRVTDNNVPPMEAISTISTSVAWTNVPPVANAGGPYSVDMGTGIAFNGTASSDPNAPCDAIVSYSWSIANGTYALAGPTPSLAAEQVNLLCAGITYPVRLTVTDSFGVIGIAETTLAVNMTTFAIATSPGVTCTPNPVNFNSSSVCTITPTTGYHIKDVLVDGLSHGIITSYTFTNVTSPRSISASFEADPANIVVLPASPCNFGSVNLGSTSAAQTFTVGNSGNMSLTIGTISSNNEEFTISNDNCSGQTVALAGNCSFQASFTPSDYGMRSATLNIPSNDPDMNVLGITLNGIGEAPNIDVVPASPAHFGSVNVGFSSSPTTFRITNLGNIPLVVMAITANNPEFVINNNFCSGDPIEPAKSCTLDVVFTPLSFGQSNATLTISTNDPDMPLFSIDLKGVGQASNIAIDPSSPVAFNSVNVGSSSDPIPFTVNNTGNIDLVMGAINSSNPEFVVSMDTCSGRAIAPGAVCMLEVVFTPSGNGTRTATLSIPSNDPDSTNVTLALTGTGVQYQLSVTGATGNAAGSVASEMSINCSIAKSGEISGTCSEMINPGSVLTLTATPQTGASVTWFGCNSSSGNTCSVTVNTVAIITASFNLNTYSIATTAGANGSVNCTPNPVSYGLSSTCSISSYSNYHVDSLTVDGLSQSPASSYTFKDVREIHSISATFAINTYTLTYAAGPYGTITGPSPQTVNYGASGSPVTAMPNNGYHFVLWNDGSTQNPRTDTNVTTNIYVTATFAMDAITYVFAGFFTPVDNLPSVNAANSGQTIPIKWRITDTNGVPVSDIASFKSLTSYTVSCATYSGNPTDAIEEYTAGSSGLQYKSDGNWQFNWKTSKTYANQCRTMVLTLGDGSTHTANFKFK